MYCIEIHSSILLTNILISARHRWQAEEFVLQHTEQLKEVELFLQLYFYMYVHYAWLFTTWRKQCFAVAGNIN